MIDFNFNIDKRAALKTVGVNALFRFGMQTAKTFKKGMLDLENTQWLTSLSIAIDDKEFVFNEVVISVTQEKNIVTTTLQGRNGTIKEYISDGDYIISINAGVIADNTENRDNEDSFFIPEYHYPKSELRKLSKILKEANTVEIQSDFLDVFGVKSAVVKSFDLIQETHSNRQGIQIQMLSDEPYEIRQIKEDYVNPT